jgi:hypothetical protein
MVRLQQNRLAGSDCRVLAGVISTDLGFRTHFSLSTRSKGMYRPSIDGTRASGMPTVLYWSGELYKHA